MRNIKKWLAASIFSVIVFALSSSVIAAIEPPDKLLDRVTGDMLQALKHNNAELKRSPDRIIQIIDRILVPYIDSTSMARWVAGREAWVSASESQRVRFENEFRDLLIRTYASTLLTYDNQVVEYFPVRGGYNKKRVMVNSVIKEPGKESVRVSFRLMNRSSSWKVYDISIEGVSLLKGFQAQFSNEIRQYGMEQVIKRIKEHNKKPLK
jgi:phospholipid transport system substrate-binding protein